MDCQLRAKASASGNDAPVGAEKERQARFSRVCGVVESHPVIRPWGIDDANQQDLIGKDVLGRGTVRMRGTGVGVVDSDDQVPIQRNVGEADLPARAASRIQLDAGEFAPAGVDVGSLDSFDATRMLL
jgi:hypothetical protein